MKFVIDTSSFRIAEHYYESEFPGFWSKFNKGVSTGAIVSVREVLREIRGADWSIQMMRWYDDNKDIFIKASAEEMAIVSDIMRHREYRHLIKRKNWLGGLPVADPFLIALAKSSKGCVVTQETESSGVKIPKICKELGVSCTNIRGLLEGKEWKNL